jgi:uncharacterized Fe-S center protein
LKYFKDEYLSHVKDKKCQAGCCTGLMNYYILPEKCTGCTLCVKKCPVNAVEGSVKKAHNIITEKCIKCGTCQAACKFGAILKR